MIREVCFDANIFVSLISQDERGSQAQSPLADRKKIIEDYLYEGLTLWEPPHVGIEVLHVLKKKLKNGLILQTEYREAQDIFLEMPILHLFNQKFYQQTVEVQKETGLSFYDSAYIACALMKQVLLLTKDVDLAKKGLKAYQNIRLI